MKNKYEGFISIQMSVFIGQETRTFTLQKLWIIDDGKEIWIYSENFTFVGKKETKNLKMLERGSK